jgi:hypothetical protein
MKDSAKILDPVKSIIALTEKIEKKKKFAYVNISRSAINAATNNSEKKPPKYFMKALSKCMSIQDENFLKAIPSEFSREVEIGKLSEIGLTQENTYYDAGMFEHFFSHKKEVVDIFLNHYIKNSKNVVLTFHDQKTVQKLFGMNQYVVTVPYNNYYDKLDSIAAQISEFNDGVDNCILDCPMLATAIAPKIWQDMNMSIIDFGKVVSSAKFHMNSERNFSKKEEDKRPFRKNNGKR